MNITIGQARDLAIKLFGLYCIIHCIVMAPQLVFVVTLSPVNTEMGTSRTSLFLTLLIPVSLYLMLGILFLFRTGWVKGLLWKETPPPDSKPSFQASSLSFWIVLIGVFYFIRSAAGLGSRLYIWGAADPSFGGSFLSMQFLPDLVLFPLSLLCIFRAQAIEHFIRRRALGPHHR